MPAPKVDCFYVYPTVSSQPGPNANLNRDPELVSIARQQASVAGTCKVFAPIYPQYTVPAILGGQVSQKTVDIAYSSFLASGEPRHI